MRFTHLLLAAPAALAVITCAFAQAAPSDPPGAENLRPGIVVGQKRDPAAWRELVDQMVARGAMVDEANYEKIIAYLTEGG